MNKACLIIIWFGSLPNYFDLWSKSVGNNSNIDFMLITDADIENHYIPNNLIVQRSNLSLIKDKFQNLFDFDISLSSSYKLCDYRPCYGLAFSEELKKYEYWGHCDLDVIFGDVYSYIKDKLGIYDRILNRGHLCFYKNTPYMNSLYLKTDESTNNAISYKYAFTQEFPCFFDETKGINLVSDLCKWYHEDYENFIIDIFPDDFEFHSWSDKRKFIVKWENGKIYKVFLDNKSQQEYMYVHFQKRVMKCECDLSEVIYIRPNIFSNNSDYYVSKYTVYFYKLYLFRMRLRRVWKRIRQFGFLKYITHKRFTG